MKKFFKKLFLSAISVSLFASPIIYFSQPTNSISLETMLTSHGVPKKPNVSILPENITSDQSIKISNSIDGLYNLNEIYTRPNFGDEHKIITCPDMSNPSDIIITTIKDKENKNKRLACINLATGQVVGFNRNIDADTILSIQYVPGDNVSNNAILALTYDGDQLILRELNPDIQRPRSFLKEYRQYVIPLNKDEPLTPEEIETFTIVNASGVASNGSNAENYVAVMPRAMMSSSKRSKHSYFYGVSEGRLGNQMQINDYKNDNYYIMSVYNAASIVPSGNKDHFFMLVVYEDGTVGLRCFTSEGNANTQTPLRITADQDYNNIYQINKFNPNNIINSLRGVIKDFYVGTYPDNGVNKEEVDFNIAIPFKDGDVFKIAYSNFQSRKSSSETSGFRSLGSPLAFPNLDVVDVDIDTYRYKTSGLSNFVFWNSSKNPLILCKKAKFGSKEFESCIIELELDSLLNPWSEQDNDVSKKSSYDWVDNNTKSRFKVYNTLSPYLKDQDLNNIYLVKTTFFINAINPKTDSVWFFDPSANNNQGLIPYYKAPQPEIIEPKDNTKLYIIIGASIGVILIIAILAFVIYKQNKSKQKLEKKLATRAPRALPSSRTPMLPSSGPGSRNPQSPNGGQYMNHNHHKEQMNQRPMGSDLQRPVSRSGMAAQKPGMRPSNGPPPPPKIEINAPPKSFAPKRR